MNLIFIYGPPASGKYTVSKTLSEITEYKHFHNHLTYDTAHALFGDDVYSIPFKVCCEKLRLTAISEAVTNKVDVIFTFVYDHATDQDFVQQLKEVVESGGGKIYFVCLNPSIEIIEKRVIEDSRKSFKKVASLEELKVFRKHYDIYSFVPNVECLVIDNSYLKPKDVAEKIIKNIKI
jgi:cytidylate kinase